LAIQRNLKKMVNALPKSAIHNTSIFDDKKIAAIHHFGVGFFFELSLYSAFKCIAWFVSAAYESKALRRIIGI